MYLINVAVDVLTTEKVFNPFLNKDAVIVLETDLVTAIAFLMVITDASVTDNKSK